MEVSQSSIYPQCVLHSDILYSLSVMVITTHINEWLDPSNLQPATETTLILRRWPLRERENLGSTRMDNIVSSPWNMCPLSSIRLGPYIPDHLPSRWALLPGVHTLHGSPICLPSTHFQFCPLDEYWTLNTISTKYLSSPSVLTMHKLSPEPY